MSAEDDTMDDDRWLYGEEDDEQAPGQSENIADADLEDIVREGTPDLDEIEATSGLSAPGLTPNSAPSTNALELHLKSVKQEKGEEEREVPDEESEPPEKKGDKENEDSVPSDSDDDDDVNITIGEILNPTAPYSRVGFGRMPSLLTPGGTEGVAPVKKVDLDVVPQVNGVPLPEVDLESVIDKPWRKPGADITDYFNYGFTEDTWRLYCEKQRKMRQEVNQLNKLVVTTAAPVVLPTVPKTEMSKMFGLPQMEIQLPQQNSISQSGSAVSNPSELLDNESLENAEEKGTPPPEASIQPPKLPILPPPGLPPPPMPFPPSQDVSAAAAMAAMLTGGPPPPIRPPDFHPGFPPPMPGAIPHFPPPMPAELRPPFLPPAFGMGGEPPRGPLTLDDPRAAGMFNSDMGFPPPWDHALAAAHTEMLEFPPQGDYGRGSRSPSRSSSSASRGSSVERVSRHSRRERTKDKYERSHHRSRRSRSRDHHRRSHRDHRDRDHRERERDRDRDRDRDRERRHDKERRERRRREDRERRHERSKKHREHSHSPDEEEGSRERSSKRSRSRSVS